MPALSCPGDVAQDVCRPGRGGVRPQSLDLAPALLSVTPHKGNTRDQVAPGLRAIPAGRRPVVALVVDDTAREALIFAVSYAGADWIARSSARRR